MSDRMMELRALIKSATEALRLELDQDATRAPAEKLAHLRAASALAERNVDQCLEPILDQGAKCADDLVCLAEAARFYVRSEFEGPPVFENSKWERVAMALTNGVLKVHSTMDVTAVAATRHSNITRMWHETEITGQDHEDCRDILVIETTVPLSSPGADERVDEWSRIIDDARRLLKNENLGAVRIVSTAGR